ncbi:hypothetical protein [Streptomyces lichenis]|uniref:CU044_5270 family protein n=1 Tax=Streptomyces lichenis TaxID=2306967 RepID=A0ABT0I454_9ACTN|nr:hypothetical protein [Streptomyces lichenis]MCK8676118.1 hypothetical protein [Streptomyces lichenis]
MDEMARLRRFRAEAPDPDPARLASARRRLQQRLDSHQPRRRNAGWWLTSLATAAAVSVVAFLCALPLRSAGAPADPATPVPQAHRWVYQEVRWDTWDCASGASTSGFSEVGPFDLGPAAPRCRAEPARQVRRDKWVRYDGGALAMPAGPSGRPGDVDVWEGRYQGGWQMLSPDASDRLVADLPADRAAALRMIRARSVPDQLVGAGRSTAAQRDFSKIVELMAGASDIADGKAVLLRDLVAGLAGATAPVRVTDGAGRPALALGVDGYARDYSDERNALQVLLDPDTFAYRGVRYVAGVDYRVGGGSSGGPFVREGTVVATATRLRTEVVDTSGTRP